MHGNLGKTFRVKHALISNRKSGSHNPSQDTCLAQRHTWWKEEAMPQLCSRWHILSHTFDVDGTDSHESDSKRAIEFLHARLRTFLAWHTQTSTLIRSWRNNKNLTTNVSTQPTLTHCHKDDNPNQIIKSIGCHTQHDKKTPSHQRPTPLNRYSGSNIQPGYQETTEKNQLNVSNKEHEPLLAKLERGCTFVTTE